MADQSVLDFRQQAEQMMRIVEGRLEIGQRQAGIEFLILKFKALYEQGVIAGRLYEKDGIYPYTSMENDKRRT